MAASNVNSAKKSRSGMLLASASGHLASNSSRLKARIQNLQNGMERMKISNIIPICRVRDLTVSPDKPLHLNSMNISGLEQQRPTSLDWDNFAELSSSPKRCRIPLSPSEQETSCGGSGSLTQYVGTSQDLLFTVRQVEEGDSCTIESSNERTESSTNPVGRNHSIVPLSFPTRKSGSTSQPSVSQMSNESWGGDSDIYEDDEDDDDEDDDLLEAFCPLPATWTPIHDRMICQLDVQPDMTYSRIVTILRGTFPDLRDEAMNGKMIETRLEYLDQLGEQCDYWKTAIEISNESKLNKKSLKIKSQDKSQERSSTEVVTQEYRSEQLPRGYVRIVSSPWEKISGKYEYDRSDQHLQGRSSRRYSEEPITRNGSIRSERLNSRPFMDSSDSIAIPAPLRSRSYKGTAVKQPSSQGSRSNPYSQWDSGLGSRMESFNRYPTSPLSVTSYWHDQRRGGQYEPISVSSSPTLPPESPTSPTSPGMKGTFPNLQESYLQSVTFNPSSTSTTLYSPITPTTPFLQERQTNQSSQFLICPSGLAAKQAKENGLAAGLSFNSISGIGTTSLQIPAILAPLASWETTPRHRGVTVNDDDGERVIAHRDLALRAISGSQHGR